MTDSPAPRTEAGRAMLYGIQIGSERLDVALNALDYILAIEREAAAAPPVSGSRQSDRIPRTVVANGTAQPLDEKGRSAAEWHRYLHQEGILVEDEPGQECGPWHHRVFLDEYARPTDSAERPEADDD